MQLFRSRQVTSLRSKRRRLALILTALVSVSAGLGVGTTMRFRLIEPNQQTPFSPQQNFPPLADWPPAPTTTNRRFSHSSDWQNQQTEADLAEGRELKERQWENERTAAEQDSWEDPDAPSMIDTVDQITSEDQSEDYETAEEGWGTGETAGEAIEEYEADYEAVEEYEAAEEYEATEEYKTADELGETPDFYEAESEVEDFGDDFSEDSFSSGGSETEPAESFDEPFGALESLESGVKFGQSKHKMGVRQADALESTL